MKKTNGFRLKEIPVFFSSDDNYVPCLVVSIQSLIETSNKNRRYAIYVLNSGLTLSNRKLIKNMEKSNIKIRFVDITSKVQNIYAKLEDQLRDYYSPSIFYRLFIPSLFPQYKKALYLDCDITILEDVAKLYNTNLQGKLVGAIVDNVVSSDETLRQYTAKSLGISWDKYFNSGILVMNLEMFRKNKIEEKFIYLLNNYHFGTLCPDQDYLNVLCKNKVKFIDKKWDRMPIPDPNFKDETLCLIHYNMFEKPWKYKGVLYEEYFWLVAKRTPFYDTFIKQRDSYGADLIEKDQKARDGMIEYASKVINDKNNFYNTYQREYLSLLSVVKSDMSISQLLDITKLHLKSSNDSMNRNLEEIFQNYLEKNMNNELNFDIFKVKA